MCDWGKICRYQNIAITPEICIDADQCQSLTSLFPTLNKILKEERLMLQTRAGDKRKTLEEIHIYFDKGKQGSGAETP